MRGGEERTIVVDTSPHGRTVSASSALVQAIERIESDPLKIAFVVDDDGVLVGVITDGDVRRWLIGGGAVTSPVSECMNRDFHAVREPVSLEELSAVFARGFGVVPSVDDQGRLVDVHVRRASMKVDNFVLGGDRVFVIAEIGNNHQGSLELAKRLIDAAIGAGADAVKFQIRDRNTLYRRKADGSRAEDLGVEYIQDLLDKVELSVDEHRQLREYCRAKHVTYICTPWDETSVDVLADFDVAAIKIASADLVNPYLIAKAATLGKPLILSTGMSYEHEIVQAIDQLNAIEAQFALLHCNSTYPAPETDIHLGYIKRLKELHGLIGYSGHERGTAITLGAVALGATIIERHITLDRGMEGPDHLASLEPAEFKDLVIGIRQLEAALPWTGPGRHASQGELLNRENLGKSVIAAVDIPRGSVFSEVMFRIASPGQGLAPYRLADLIGKTSGRDIHTGDFLFESDLDDVKAEEKFSFDLPVRWGVPVRYHDFLEYRRRIDPGIYEFHLSYRDLSVKPQPFLAEVGCDRLVVHAPELFENSELLDLVSDDLAYRQRSVDNVQRVVDATMQIAEFFPAAKDFLIVGNVGGFSADEPLPLGDRDGLYERYYESIAKVDFGRTELTPQNMAPFPWHFGGQRHQNIFMMPDELAEQARAHGIRYTLDLSHLSMMCSHFELDFQDAMALLLPYTAHLHIGDAAGSNGEGVLIGSGDIDWQTTWAQIIKYPEISFIPEVWQGHKDHGAGFWAALRFLEQLGSPEPVA